MIFSASTRSPPTCLTMSARMLIVVTALIVLPIAGAVAAGAAVGAGAPVAAGAVVGAGAVGAAGAAAGAVVGAVVDEPAPQATRSGSSTASSQCLQVRWCGSV